MEEASVRVRYTRTCSLYNFSSSHGGVEVSRWLVDDGKWGNRMRNSLECDASVLHGSPCSFSLPPSTATSPSISSSTSTSTSCSSTTPRAVFLLSLHFRFFVASMYLSLGCRLLDLLSFVSLLVFLSFPRFVSPALPVGLLFPCYSSFLPRILNTSFSPITPRELRYARKYRRVMPREIG